MTERIVEHGLEIAKTDGLVLAVVAVGAEAKKDDDINKSQEMAAKEEIVARGVEEELFSEDLIRAAHREAILARVALKHRRRSRGI